MTPKENAAAALERRRGDKVPTMEIVFELEHELLGKRYTLGKELERLSGAQKVKALNANIGIYEQVARTLNHSAITIHPAPTPWYIPGNNYYPTLEDELYVIKNLSRELGDEYFVAAGIDATLAIPDGEGFIEFVYRLQDEKDEVLRQCAADVDWALEQMYRLIDAGAGVMYCCSDYCFNTGPFLSPAMFEQFVYPFLYRQTQSLRKAGAYVIKHTDGNIELIADMLVDCQPHCIHSIDPIAGMELSAFKARYGDRVCVMGNVDAAKLQCGTVEEIERSCRGALAGGKPGRGYIYSTCNSVFEGIPLENYRLMLSIWNEQAAYETEERL